MSGGPPAAPPATPGADAGFAAVARRAVEVARALEEDLASLAPRNHKDVRLEAVKDLVAQLAAAEHAAPPAMPKGHRALFGPRGDHVLLESDTGGLISFRDVDTAIAAGRALVAWAEAEKAGGR